MTPSAGKGSPTVREIKRLTLKPVDAWWTVLAIDPVAVRILWLLARTTTRLTPNAITTFSIVVGIAAGLAFGADFYLAGAVLYEVAFLLDCLDGKWGRLQGMSSPFGSFYDGLAGNIIFSSVVVGLAYQDGIERNHMLALVGAGILLVVRGLNNYLTIYQKKRDESVHTIFAPGEQSWLRRHRLLAPLAFPDRHLLMFVIGPLIGQVGWFLIGVGVLEGAMQLAKGLKIRRALAQATPGASDTQG